jgi:pyruvate formate lyase activating enzyme
LMLGQIFDIKRFAIHDGPGIRTTVFLKGCYLRCAWCHNPEGINSGNDIWVKRERCIGCKTCVGVCKNRAIIAKKSGIHIDKSKCNFCDECVRECPARAIQRIDSIMKDDELIENLLKDSVFYHVSSGGVTLSGGEPLFQPNFTRSVLKKLKEKGINTCIETSMFADRTVFSSIIPFVDHFLVDIKLLDEALHKQYTGVSNELILNNFEYLLSQTDSVQVRIPLIPGITATKENISAIAKFVKKIAPSTKIELLNFNSFAYSKYQTMGMNYYDENAREFTHEELGRFKEMLKV